MPRNWSERIRLLSAKCQTHFLNGADWACRIFYANIIISILISTPCCDFTYINEFFISFFICITYFTSQFIQVQQWHLVIVLKRLSKAWFNYFNNSVVRLLMYELCAREYIKFSTLYQKLINEFRKDFISELLLFKILRMMIVNEYQT